MEDNHIIYHDEQCPITEHKYFDEKKHKDNMPDQCHQALMKRHMRNIMFFTIGGSLSFAIGYLVIIFLTDSIPIPSIEIDWSRVGKTFSFWCSLTALLISINLFIRNNRRN